MVLEVAWVSPTITDTVQAIQPNDTITLSGSQMIAYGVPTTCPACQKGDLGSGIVALIDQGNDPVGNMFWGRWVPGSPTPISVTDSSSQTVNAVGVPYIFGAFATSVPIANPVGTTSVTFAFAGGPNPVDASGNVGTITSGGSLRVDFLARTVNMASPLQFNIGGLSYSMTTLTLLSNPGGPNYPAAPAQPTISGNLSGTCSGGICGTPITPNAEGPVKANFTGATGAGLGIALATVITSPAPNVALAAGYKCPSC